LIAATAEDGNPHNTKQREIQELFEQFNQLRAHENDANREINSMADCHRPHESGAMVETGKAPSNHSAPVIGGLVVEMREKQSKRDSKHEKRQPGRSR